MMSKISVEGDQIGKANRWPFNMHGESRRTRGIRKNTLVTMMPEISAAQHLLQLCVDNIQNCHDEEDFSMVTPPKFKDLKSPPKFQKVEDEDHQYGGEEEEESKSDVSYITDDDISSSSSGMETTTLAEISAAQQIMQLSNPQQKQVAAEEEEESTRYNTTNLSSVVASTRKDFEDNKAYLPRKRKFRSLADLYEITHPLEDLDPYFDL